MLGRDGYREGPMSICPGFKEHCFTAEDQARMREAGILIKGDGNFLRDGRVVCDTDHLDRHAPLRGVAGEYRHDEGLKVGGRIWTQAEMYRLTEIGAFWYHKHVILWAGGIYDPLRPSPMACHISTGVADLFCDLDGFRRVDGRKSWAVVGYGPLTLREGFLPIPDLVVIPEAFLRRPHWPPAAEYPLVIEVEDPEIPGNKAFKFAEYARAGVPEFWLVSGEQAQVAIYRKGAYDTPEIVRPGQSIPLTFLGADPPRITVGEIFR